jgi:hypothetical protein
MKKTILTLTAAAMLLCGNAFAQGGRHHSPQCGGPDTDAFVTIDAAAGAVQFTQDMDFNPFKDGFSGSKATGFSAAGFMGSGWADNGTVSIDGVVQAGSITQANDITTLGISVPNMVNGSSMAIQNTISADIDLLAASTPTRFSAAKADVLFGGITMTDIQSDAARNIAPFFMTDGSADAHATQNSMGYFLGSAVAGDNFPFDPATIASVDVGIDILGGTYAATYDYFDNGNGYRVEGIGDVAGSYTGITSWDNSDHNLGGRVNVIGGWNAAGTADVSTVQTTRGGILGATAGGSYTGSGSLGQNYTGSIDVGSYTSVTKINGYKGSINTAGAYATGQSITTTSATAPF